MKNAKAKHTRGRLRKITCASFAILCVIFCVGLGGFAYLLWIAGAVPLPGWPPYMAEDTPEGVAYNYQLALMRGDYTRALGHLSETLPNRPANAGELVEDLRASGQLPSDKIQRCVYVTEAAQIDGDWATIRLWEQHYHACSPRPSLPANLSYNYITTDLHRQDGVWKIVYAERYFAPCWNLE